MLQVCENEINAQMVSRYCATAHFERNIGGENSYSALENHAANIFTVSTQLETKSGWISGQAEY